MSSDTPAPVAVGRKPSIRPRTRRTTDPKAGRSGSARPGSAGPASARPGSSRPRSKRAPDGAPLSGPPTKPPSLRPRVSYDDDFGTRPTPVRPPPSLRPRSNRLSDAPSAQVEIQGAEGDDACESLYALRSMVEPSDLSVVFQPIVSLPDGELFAYEALVRCRVAEFRNPLALFERAVQIGCTGRLGRMIREIGVPLASGIPLFVNIHPKELSEGWLVRPDDPIFTHDHDVYLEITESTPLSHYDLCMNVLKEVCTRGGVYLVIDDLGAGYSNLKRIADLEPKVVKIDRELIAGLDTSRRQRELVAAVVDLCTRLGAKVVAEGIETVRECWASVDAGVHYGQGYLFARPGYPLPDITWPPVDAVVEAPKPVPTTRRGH
jgi:EAL domain-containing protein (putative c-di-GMP-specific phosphodiesterase class I)